MFLSHLVFSNMIYNIKPVESYFAFPLSFSLSLSLPLQHCSPCVLFDAFSSPLPSVKQTVAMKNRE